MCCLCAPSRAAPQTATINGAEISYEVCGAEDAPAVVLLHDGLVNSAAWDSVWPGLCGNFRAVRYDRRGYGRSPPAKMQHAPAEDLAALMRHVGLDHAHIIGAHIGAGIALDFLFAYPESIDRLVFVSPAITGLQPNDSMVARLRALDEVVRAGDMDATLEAINSDPYFFGPGNPEARAKLAEILKASPGDLGAHPHQRRSNDTARRLGEVYAPTLIFIGSADHPYAQAVAGAMHERMRAAKIDVLLGSGQFLYLERPGAFVEAVSAFLE